MKSRSRFWLCLPFAVLAGWLTLQFGCDAGKEVAKSLSAAANHEENAQQKKVHSNTNMKYIGLGIHHYAQFNRAFPPAYTADKSGKPLLSWRVLILPYVGQEALYKQFRFDEPWDSDNNKKLLAQMPDIYKAPGSTVADQWKTNYLAVRGDDTVISGQMPNKFGAVSDGLTKTIMTVEVSDAKAVEWTRPDDFQFNPQNPLEGVVGLREGCFIAGVADGSVLFVPASKSADVLRGWFNKSDGSSVDVTDDK